MKFVLVFLLIMGASLVSNAQQRIGTGGGEAELKILAMLPLLKVWNKACDENPNICWSDAATSRKITGALKIALIDFKPGSVLFSDAKSHNATCDQKGLVLNRSHFYVDEQTPKNDTQISIELANSILSCRGLKFQIQNQRVLKLPIGKYFADIGLAVFTNDPTSLFATVNENQNAQELLSQEIQCRDFQFLIKYQNTLVVRCLTNQLTYKVQVVSVYPFSIFAVLD